MYVTYIQLSQDKRRSSSSWIPSGAVQDNYGNYINDPSQISQDVLKYNNRNVQVKNGFQLEQ